jgi:hypothetical protein
MIEYLVPREKLRPVLLIRPTFTLQAIAAAVFADRANGEHQGFSRGNPTRQLRLPTALPVPRSKAHSCFSDAKCGDSHREGRQDRRMEYRNDGSDGCALRALYAG